MKEILKAKNLHKYFYEPDEFHELNDISLSVKKGEFVAITGKSGCGKSTLMYLLATLDTDYGGSIEINCTKITGLKQNELALSVMNILVLFFNIIFCFLNLLLCKT
jgi:lipoprotein-releasing system ATP-binding protein